MPIKERIKTLLKKIAKPQYILLILLPILVLGSGVVYYASRNSNPTTRINYDSAVADNNSSKESSNTTSSMSTQGESTDDTSIDEFSDSTTLDSTTNTSSVVSNSNSNNNNNSNIGSSNNNSNSNNSSNNNNSGNNSLTNTTQSTTSNNNNSTAFTHPGILHSAESFTYMKNTVVANTSPNADTFRVLLSTGFSNASWNPRAVDVIIRGGNGDNVSKLYIDIARAYQCALIWKINGSAAHGEAACRILNAWSSTLTTISGNADRYLASGLFGYQFANIAEIMRDHPSFKLAQFKSMLLNVFYPMNERFLIGNEWGSDHNNAYISNYWANWDLCNMASVVAIGIFCDRTDIYNQGINYYKYGLGNGSIYNAIPFIYSDGTAQWQESGRDQGHSNLGIGLMACVCEMAWNQGDDIYGWANNRFLKAAEYVARYNNGQDVQFSTYEWGTGTKGTIATQTVISASGRGEVRPIWSMIYNHYVNRKGLTAPNIKARLESVGNAEYGAGGHATTFDQPGWGTLTFTGNVGRKTAAEPAGNINSGTYRIINVHTGKSLTLLSSGAVGQSSKGSASNQLWTVSYLGGGEYKIINSASNTALQIQNSSHDNGALITLGAYNGNDSQRFAFLPTDTGNYRIIASISGKAIDVRDWSSDDNAQMIQWRYVMGNNQKWILEKLS